MGPLEGALKEAPVMTTPVAEMDGNSAESVIIGKVPVDGSGVILSETEILVV